MFTANPRRFPDEAPTELPENTEKIGVFKGVEARQMMKHGGSVTK
jgi:hypothetical protein